MVLHVFFCLFFISFYDCSQHFLMLQCQSVHSAFGNAQDAETIEAVPKVLYHFQQDMTPADGVNILVKIIIVTRPQTVIIPLHIRGHATKYRFQPGYVLFGSTFGSHPRGIWLQ
jgi:hypothetical protein